MLKTVAWRGEDEVTLAEEDGDAEAPLDGPGWQKRADECWECTDAFKNREGLSSEERAWVAIMKFGASALFAEINRTTGTSFGLPTAGRESELVDLCTECLIASVLADLCTVCLLGARTDGGSKEPCEKRSRFGKDFSELLL
mmetsp:Transcript_113863/g.179207  ORF Transcript_113863/g.179207 Transcript_113863/m.179207 type:complete len:142 (-) Transcript_113863:292-717(-)